MDVDEELTVSNVVELIRELLVVYIHSILYYHEIYPKYIFEPFRSFNLVTYKSRSKTLNEYIDKFIDDLIQLLITSNQINDLSIVLYNRNQNYYKYSIKFDEFANLSSKISHGISAPINIEGFGNQLYKQFNSFLFYHIQHLKKISVTIELEMKLLLNCQIELNRNDNWVYNQQKTDLENLKPLQEVSVEFINFASYVEYNYVQI